MDRKLGGTLRGFVLSHEVIGIKAKRARGSVGGSQAQTETAAAAQQDQKKAI